MWTVPFVTNGFTSPSSLPTPDSQDCSSLSQLSDSLAVISTRSLSLLLAIVHCCQKVCCKYPMKVSSSVTIQGSRKKNMKDFQATTRPVWCDVWCGYDGWCDGHWWSVSSTKRQQRRKLSEWGGNNGGLIGGRGGLSMFRHYLYELT